MSIVVTSIDYLPLVFISCTRFYYLCLLYE
nr:MAG TPA: hypothetical protein [Caudoviricetes sp.]